MVRKSKKIKSKNVVEETSDINQDDVSNYISTTSVLEASEDAHQHMSRCGGKLRKTREEQGLSTKDIAKQLRLSSIQIEALEQDNFSDLPEATIVKGFIRNYAKLLKIPAQPLLDAYMVIVPVKELHSLTLKPGINIKISAHRESRTKRHVFFGFVLLLGLGLWWFYQNYVQKPNPVKPTAELVESVTDFLPEIVLPTPAEADASPSVQLQLPVQLPESATQASTATEPAAAETATEIIDSMPSPPVLAAGKHRLQFSASQETWISVVNASGQELYNKTLFAGNHDVVDFKPPFEVVVGNAQGVTLLVDGKPMDLTPHTRINVARIRLN